MIEVVVPKVELIGERVRYGRRVIRINRETVELPGQEFLTLLHLSIARTTIRRGWWRPGFKTLLPDGFAWMAKVYRLRRALALAPGSLGIENNRRGRYRLRVDKRRVVISPDLRADSDFWVRSAFLIES